MATDRSQPNTGTTKQNLIKAIFLINLHVVLYTCSTSMFKVAKQEFGATPADFMIFRYGVIAIITFICLYKARINPFTDVSSENN